MARYEDLRDRTLLLRPPIHACRQVGVYYTAVAMMCNAGSANTRVRNLQVCVWRETSDCPDRPLLLRPPRSPVLLPGKALVRPALPAHAA